jgi:putative endonuclease
MASKTSMPSLNSIGATLLERSLATIDRVCLNLGRAPDYAPHLAVGVRGEEAALFYLRRLGFVITARSWRSHRYAGDLDLIGWEGDCLCFIEVKTRTTRDVAAAEAAVDLSKRKTMRKMARHYLRQLPDPEQLRFDVLSIYFEKDAAADFLLLRNAFDWTEHPRY